MRTWLASAGVFALLACSGDGPSDPGTLPAQRGSLVVTINGLPAGASANVTVTGPGGFSRPITSTTTLTGLTSGTYNIDAADVSHDGSSYAASTGSASVTVAPGASTNAPNVSYIITTGSLAVALSGYPSGTPPQVLISGPDGYSRTISEPTSVSGLKPGLYSVEAREVQTPNARYAATPGIQQVAVGASTVPAQANVAYAISSGSITLNVNGLPPGVNAAISVTGPGNYTQSATGPTVLEKLVPGVYTISASNVTSGALYQPAPPVQQVNVPASVEAVGANVFYASAGTSLSVQVVGLPSTIPATVTVTGPNGSVFTLTGTQVMSGIPAGAYTVTATAITMSCTTYTPTPPAQNINVVSGQSATATVTYTTPPGGLNLCIEGAYITQAVQRFDNSVPLVAGRNALLRVFVRASSDNSALPSVRVRFYNGATLVNTITIPPPAPAVPTATDESVLNNSWNATLAGQALQPGLRMLIDVDPSNAVLEADEADNMLPANGTPATLDIRTVAALNVRLVPVIQATRGDTARIDESNKAAFINPMLKMFPVATINSDVHAPYTYTGPELASGGGNWNALLSEINALRISEASGRAYYGVVRVGYTSGVAGLGYIGLPAAIGWDYQPSGTEVMAHEMGHNFGRLHAPCGNPAGADGQYPYSGATLGSFGYDIFTNAVKFPNLRDLMSYCDPSWISDYTYKGILNFRASNPGSPNVASNSTTSNRGVLIWGRIDNGRMILEPAIEVDAPPSLPSRSGPHRIEAFGPRGEALFSLAFAGERIADSADPNDENFAFVVPMSQLRGIDLDRLRLTALGRQVERRGTGGGAIPTAVRTGRGVRVTWNAAGARVALIRDARTGEILSFARAGAVDLPSATNDLEITLSDGVKSVRSRLRPR